MYVTLNINKMLPFFYRRIHFIKVLIVIVLLVWLTPAKAQTTLDDIPMIGAEVFIEPGQTPQEIDSWFRLMQESGMTITRIRMFESYMHLPDGSWDYTLFDYAFRAGEKYNIKIYGNLFPATSFTDVGGFKFPKNDANLASIAEYIKNLVNHFKQFKSLYGWVPVNEPGNAGIPNDTFSRECFLNWKNCEASVNASSYNSNGYPMMDFSEQKFLVYYNVWFLNWLVQEIHKYDPGKPVHINNHNIFKNVAEYDFPQWRHFLTSLGGSAHASWHFDYFNRQEYAVAMSANSEILRSGAGNIPWLMTELQGGNNTYSGGEAMCPTKEETAQWLWTTIGTGSKGAIFWCLNPRSSGFEAGEWAMLDYQDHPSDRMQEAASIAKIINDNTSLFAHARVAESGISILYTRESLWIEKKLSPTGVACAGRDEGGVMKSALGYFEAISQMGVQANFQEIGEYDFTKEDYAGKTIILSHQVSIASRYWPSLEAFVSKGGKLIVDGLTAYYDENAHCILRSEFPFKKIFGGSIKEFKLIDTLFEEQCDGIDLTAHLWQGTIEKATGTESGNSNGKTIALRNHYGKGDVFWVPSLLGLGARLTHNYNPLCQLLAAELKSTIAAQPVAFKEMQPQMLMKNLRSGNYYISVVINKAKDKRRVQLLCTASSKNPTLLFTNKGGKLSNDIIEINPEETLVIKW